VSGFFFVQPKYYDKLIKNSLSENIF